VDDWFRSSLKGELPETLLDGGSLMFDFLNPEPVQTLLQNHRSGKQDYHKLLFSLVMFEEWLRSFRSRQPVISISDTTPLPVLH